jgi:hypothetical protein
MSKIMKLEDFVIGTKFVCGGKVWQCTDKGQRVVVAIPFDSLEVVRCSASEPPEAKTVVLSRSEAEDEGWFHGPPYAIEELVFDEHDQEGCSPV